MFPNVLKLKLAAVLLLVSSLLFAGTTGKIAGVIKDKQSGDPLPGVNVVVEETKLGAVTDFEGHYFVTQVPPGVYTVRASLIGYREVHVTNVQVNIDLTTSLNFDLEATVLESGEAVVIVAERPLVQKDITAKMAIVAGDRIAERMPVTTFFEALATQAGFVQDENGSIHVRGGRLGEIAYLIDGIYVENPFSGGFGAELEIEAIKEMEVLSGTFNAEYGDAMSAVINVVTKEGSDKYHGKLQYESPMLNDSPYHQKDWLLTLDEVKSLPLDQQEQYKDAVRDSLGNSAYRFVSVLDHPHVKRYTLLPMLGTVSANFSGPVPLLSKLNFFLTGRFANENSQLPFGFDILRLGTLKLNYDLAANLKASYGVEISRLYTQDYVHNYKYYFYNEEQGIGSYPTIEEGKQRHSLIVTHTLNRSTFYTLSGSYFRNREQEIVPNSTVIADPNTGELIASTYLPRTFVRGIDTNFRLGDVRYWTKTRTETYNLKFDLTSQIQRHHQIKTGLDFKRHDIFRHQIGMPPRGQLEFFDRGPKELAVYVQDKLEYDFMILNIGLRFDYADPQDFYLPDPGNALIRVTDASGQSSFITPEKQRAPAKRQFSPRIGLAHPVTDKTVLHFSYGHFFQNPRYYDLYRNDDLRDILANDALVGNPGLKPQRTTAFEVGLKQQLTDDMVLDVTAYSKDVKNLVSSFFYFTQGRGYTIFTNADFGRIQGIDVTIDKRYSNYVSGQFNYTFSVAKGNESDPLEGYNSYREETAHLRPNRDFYLDFDRRHDFSLNVDLRFPAGFGPEIFGVKPLANTGLNVLAEMASGLPYTPLSREGEEASVNPEKNSARKPWTKTVDLRAIKDFRAGGLQWRAFLKVENLLDNINVLRVWERTGDAWDQGPTSVLPKDRQANPENTGPRRTIRLGAFVQF
jgi:outer membrane receptor protein involved in Fe transport